jgi:hypothetical protein
VLRGLIAFCLILIEKRLDQISGPQPIPQAYEGELLPPRRAAIASAVAAFGLSRYKQRPQTEAAHMLFC